MKHDNLWIKINGIAIPAKSVTIDPQDGKIICIENNDSKYIGLTVDFPFIKINLN